MDFLSLVKEIVGSDNAFADEKMDRHTTFRAGGPAKYLAAPSDENQVLSLIRLCGECDVPYYVVGNGSNLLVSDKGYDGLIILIGSNMASVSVDGEIISAGAGTLLSAIGNRALKESLTGFEFAAGIPGSLGGAIVMNAGAYGGEMAQVVESVTLFSAACGKVTKRTEEMHFGYRHSILKEENWTVLEVVISLEPGDRKEIREKMDQLAKQRIEKQPLEYPSAGSTFKRPEGYFAGKLIQDAGLRGYTVGGAQVSEKHCGFVINKNHATATDIYRLIMDVQEKVKHDTGVMLEPEVILLGDFQT